jgi:DNA-binding LacI/PurR family transcriptional regulator
MQHLAELGHRRVLWFGRENALDLRHALAQQCAQEQGLQMNAARAPEVADEGLLGDTPYLIEHYTRAFSQWLEGNGPVSAVLAADEKAAFGVCRALLHARLRVPQDVSVAGYDDIRASLCDPPLTVVSQCLAEVGETAAKMALELADETERAAKILRQPVAVPSRLVVRKSTGPAHGTKK